MYCNHCGNKLPPESLFCNRCGSKVEQSRLVIDSNRQGSYPPRPARRVPIVRENPTIYSEVDEYQDNQEDEDYEEDETQPDDQEDVIFCITPAFHNVGVAYALTTIVAILITAGVAYIQGPIKIALALAVICFIYPINQHIQLKRVVYTLTRTKIEIESGIFSQNVRNIPLRHVQDVTVNQTFGERLIGVGDVIIDSAAMGGKIVMSNINDPRRYADWILDQLQYLID